MQWRTTSRMMRQSPRETPNSARFYSGFGTQRSKVQILSARLFFKSSPLTSASKGFLFGASRFTSLKVRFKQTASRISRLTELFEPCHSSTARWAQSNKAKAVIPVPGSTSPIWTSDSSALAASAFRALDLALNIFSSTAPARYAFHVSMRFQETFKPSSPAAASSASESPRRGTARSPRPALPQ